MRIEDLLDELSRQIGLPLQLDHNRTCRLVFDKKWTLDIEAPPDRPDAIFLYSSLADLPLQGREGLYRHLLEANLFGRGAGGATLAVDGAADSVMLYRTLGENGTDYHIFVKAIEEFVAMIATWTEKIRNFAHTAMPRESALHVDPLSMVRI